MKKNIGLDSEENIPYNITYITSNLLAPIV